MFPCFPGTPKMGDALFFGLTLTYSILIAINLIGNAMVILVVLLNKSMQRPINYLLVNLAASDMTVAIFASIQFLMEPTLADAEPLTAIFLCKFLTGGTLGWVGAVCSIFNLVGLAIERYYAVIVSHRHRGKLTSGRLRVFIFVSWTLALIWAGPGFFITTYIKESQMCGHQWPKEIYAKMYTVGWSFVAGIIPIGIMGSLYYKIIYRLWFTKEKATEATQKAMLRYRKRVTKMVIAVTIIYVLCWGPELIIYFLGFLGVFTLQAIHHGVAFALIVFNSCVNPIVYSFQSSQFRTHLLSLIRFRRRDNRVVHPINRFHGLALN